MDFTPVLRMFSFPSLFWLIFSWNIPINKGHSNLKSSFWQASLKAKSSIEWTMLPFLFHFCHGYLHCRPRWTKVTTETGNHSRTLYLTIQILLMWHIGFTQLFTSMHAGQWINIGLVVVSIISCQRSMGTWVIEVTDFKSEVICDLEVIWRPPWPQRPLKQQHTHYIPGWLRLLISNLKSILAYSGPLRAL